MSVPTSAMLAPQVAITAAQTVKPTPTPSSAPAASAAAETPNVNELLKKLLAAGIIGHQAKKEEKETVAPSTSTANLQEKPEEAAMPTPSSSEEKLVLPAPKPKVGRNACRLNLIC